MKRIVIVWPGFTGYLAAPWRALAAQARVKVFIEPSDYEQGFDGRDLDGLDWRRVEDDAAFADAVQEIRAFAPDLILTCGWRTPFCRLAGKTDFGCRKVFDFDMPWEGRFRQVIARWALRPYLRRFDAAFVPGSRAAKYARWLGFRWVVEGSNPSGFERFAGPPSDSRSNRFLFVGRFSKDKGLDVLVTAYAAYRRGVANPWPLDLVGSGDALPSFGEGVRVVGFVPSGGMPDVMREHAALVLPSLWEPWGIAALEAMSAGLPVIATDACGFTSDIKPTVLVPSGDSVALAAALERIHRMAEDERRTESERVRAAAEPYSAAAWARRLVGFLDAPSASATDADVCTLRKVKK